MTLHTHTLATAQSASAMTRRYFELGWMERMTRSHAVIVTPSGRRGFRKTFGVDAAEPGDRRRR